MTINLWRHQTRSTSWNPNVWQNIAIFPGVLVKVSAHILAHGWQRVFRCVTQTKCLWPTRVFCLGLCAWRLSCRAQEKAVIFLPIKQPRACHSLSSCYRILLWFHGRKQIYISSSEKYNDFTFPQFLLIQFLSDTGAHLFISRLCLQSLANSHMRFLTPRIMIPGPGCFYLLQQHTAPVKLLSLPCFWGFLLCESTVCKLFWIVKHTDPQRACSCSLTQKVCCSI